MKTDQETFPCYLSRGKAITLDLCEERTSVYVQNLGTCCPNGCESSRRSCPVCVVQLGDDHLLGPKDSVLPASHDQRGGLCRFHRAKGEKAEREDYDPNNLPEDLLTMFGKPEKTTKKRAEIAFSADGDGKAGETLIVLRNRVRPMLGQPREFFDKEALKDLAGSMREIGQLTAVPAIPIAGDPNCDYQLIDGERRWLALEMVNIPTIKIIVEEVENEEEAFERATVANLCRVGHCPLEMARAMKRMKEKRGRTVEQLARLIGCTTTYVYNLLRVCELDPRVLKLLEPVAAPKKKASKEEGGKRSWSSPLNFWVALRLTKYPAVEQVDHAETIVKRKMSYAQAVAYLKQLDGKGSRRPSDDYNRLVVNVAHAHRWLDLIIHLPTNQFRSMFDRRSVATVRTMEGDIRVTIDKLNQLLGLVQVAKK